jgi:hypothetical protein
LPKIEDWRGVTQLEDLTSLIELYNTLVGLGRFDDAQSLFYESLDKATFHRLSANRQRIELLEMLFPSGLDQLPNLAIPGGQGYTLNALAQGYRFCGQPYRAALFFRRANALAAEMNHQGNRSVSFGNLSNALWLSGSLYESEYVAQYALILTREQDDFNYEGVNLIYLGRTLAVRGVSNKSAVAQQRSMRIFVAQTHNRVKGTENMEGVANAYLAQRALWFGSSAEAYKFANQALELARAQNFKADFIRAARLQGAAALDLRDFPAADERLHYALTQARQVNHAEEELPALTALAELRRQQGKPDEAREFLDDVWEAAERGPYPLFHADACNVLAQLERDAGNTEKAIEAATQAYCMAWCDGPPYAYHWGLEAARKHLRELGAPEPQLPPFDASKFEPMLDVEVNPKDEFYVEIGEAE